MHFIEQRLYEYLENVLDGKETISEELLQEFGERCKIALKDRISEAKESEFRLRMSNIGRPIRQLMLDKKYGRSKLAPDFVLKMLYGSLYEALTLLLFKAALGVERHDIPVSLPVTKDQIVDGTFDFEYMDKIWDIKTASPYAYDNKFLSYEDVLKNDDFGYAAQGFGYAKADNKKFGGWIVINKSTGQLRVVSIPDDAHDELMEQYLQEITTKVKYITENNSIPPCDGVIEETYYKKKSGNKILGDKCKFCSHKQVCHSGIRFLPSRVSKSDSPKYVWYVEVKDEMA